MGSGSSKDGRGGGTDSGRRQNIQKEGGREVPNSNRNTARNGSTNERRKEEKENTRNTEHFSGRNDSWEPGKNDQNNTGFAQTSSFVKEDQRNRQASERVNNNGIARSEVSNNRTNKQTMIEFVDSSDENNDSDTDSILGVDDSWKYPDRNKKNQSPQSSMKKQTTVPTSDNRLVLPPPPPSQPNHSIVFEQERALNEYNRQHGYTSGSMLKHPQISRLQQQTIENEENYPESYAHRLQRNQYRRDDSSLLREKTIYRNPDEWELEESIVQTFDADRFKAANQYKPPQQSSSQHQEQSRSYGDTRENQSSYGDHHQYIPTKRKGVPQYDDHDEQLMADIEKEFEL